MVAIGGIATTGTRSSIFDIEVESSDIYAYSGRQMALVKTPCRDLCVTQRASNWRLLWLKTGASRNGLSLTPS
jgi:hypothetical protein